MKKLISVLLSATLLIPLSSCRKGSVTISDTTAEADRADTAALVNHMTDDELAATEETDLMLLQRPWEDTGADDTDPYFESFSHKIAYEVWYVDDYISYYEEYTDEYTESERSAILSDIEENPEYYDQIIQGILVNGTRYYCIMPPYEYDGGSGEITFLHFDPETYDSTYSELSFGNYDELKDMLRDELRLCVENGERDEVFEEQAYDDLVLFFDTLIAGQVEELPAGTLEDYTVYSYEHPTASSDQQSMYWEFDEEQVRQIEDHIREFHFFDRELQKNYVIHVITPPSYDPDRSYGALVMTDAVWRFNDVYSLYTEMEQGRAEEKILVTIGQDYRIDPWDNEVRANEFCLHMREFLDFITDNMMPYLSEQYNIDTSVSCLFGHSQGGIFTHYAAFNSDLYENQPFSEYIIGSPAFWTPYFTDTEYFDGYKDEYGYFDRNDTFDKFLYLTGGTLEDADYEEYYGDNDSTLQGLSNLAERLDSHGVTSYVMRLYESNHYMYVPQMLIDYADGVLD